MKPLLRFFKLLAMTVWVGGLAFFAFVLAPTAFHVLPTMQSAGLVVGSSLKVFNRIALVCAGIFLIAAALLSLRRPARFSRSFRLELLLASAMTLGTVYLQWNIIPAMDQDQQRAGGDINTLQPSSSTRLDFDTLHRRSEQIAGSILCLGLVSIFLLSREQVEVPQRPAAP